MKVLIIMSNKADECKNLRTHVMEISRLFNEGDFIEMSERFSDDSVIIVETGDTFTKKNWLNNMTSQDINVFMYEALCVNRIEVSDDFTMGYAVFTSHSQIIKKGNPCDDVRIVSLIFKKFESDWMVVFMQQSMGRHPKENIPQFS